MAVYGLGLRGLEFRLSGSRFRKQAVRMAVGVEGLPGRSNVVPFEIGAWYGFLIHLGEHWENGNSQTP